MALDVEIYGYRQALAPSFGVSAAMHAALVLFLLLVPALLRGPNEPADSGSTPVGYSPDLIAETGSRRTARGCPAPGINNSAHALAFITSQSPLGGEWLWSAATI